MMAVAVAATDFVHETALAFQGFLGLSNPETDLLVSCVFCESSGKF